MIFLLFSSISSYLSFISIIVSVTAALNVYTTPGKVLLPAYSKVIVDCKSTPKTNVRITWENSKKTIPLYPAAGTITENIYVFANNSLIIRSLKRRNTGTYRCIASSGAERQYSEVVVKVACKSSTIYNCLTLDFIKFGIDDLL